MHNLFFQTDTALLIALIVGFTVLSGFISWLFIFSRHKSRIEKLEGVVATFFSLPAVLFSLTAALLATSVWDNYSIANKAIKSESQGIMEMISLADSVPNFRPTNLSNLAKAYTQSIVDDEWQTLASHRSASPITTEKFVALREEVFKATNSLVDKSESKILLDTFYRINAARETRLAYATFDLHPIRWYVIIFLGVLVLFAVGLVHLSKPGALMVAMLIATLTILTPLCMIALTFSSPYQGIISLSNLPYMKILK